MDLITTLGVIAVIVALTLALAHLIRVAAAAVVEVRHAPIHMAAEAAMELVKLWFSLRPKPKGKQPKGKQPKGKKGKGKGKAKAQPEAQAEAQAQRQYHIWTVTTSGEAFHEVQAEPEMPIPGNAPIVDHQVVAYVSGEVIKAEVYSVAPSGAVWVKDMNRGKDPSGRLQIEDEQAALVVGQKVTVRYSRTEEYHSGSVQYATYCQDDQDIW